MPSIMMIAKLALTLATLAYLALQIDVSAVVLQLRQSDPLMLAAGTLCLASLPLLGALRWHVIRQVIDISSRLNAVTRWTYISVFFSQVLPATIGGDALRIWLANREDGSIKAATNSVGLDRAAMLLTLALFTVAVTPGLGRLLSADQLRYLVPLLFIASVLGFVGLLRGDQLPEQWQYLRGVRAIGHLAHDARKLFLTPKVCAIVLTLSLASYFVIILSVYLFALSFGATADPATFLVLIPPVLIAAALPISIGGWGTREVAMVAALGTVGISSHTALLASLWLGLGSIIIALPGAVLYMLGNISLKPVPGTLEDVVVS